MALASAVEHFHEHGYVVLPAHLDVTELQRTLGVLFPTAEEFHGGADPERNARFRGDAFAGIDAFPYAAVEWSLATVSEAIVALAEELLGTSAIRLYEAHNWAKYTGASDYDQRLHRDFGNHTMVVPSPDDARFAEVEMFVYVHDVPLGAGPTYVVSRQHTRDLPLWPNVYERYEHPGLYAREVAADGPAGTVLAYRPDTLHRGSAMTDAGGARFMLKSSFRTVSDIWTDKLHLMQRLRDDAWYAFVDRASPRQLELLGFPPRGHEYWTPATYAATCLRYPDADLSAFEPQQPSA